MKVLSLRVTPRSDDAEHVRRGHRDHGSAVRWLSSTAQALSDGGHEQGLREGPTTHPRPVSARKVVLTRRGDARRHRTTNLHAILHAEREPSAEGVAVTEGAMSARRAAARASSVQRESRGIVRVAGRATRVARERGVEAEGWLPIFDAPAGRCTPRG